MASPYKLRSTIVGHENDVRTLTTCPLHEDIIISGSRDWTTRVWTANKSNGFQERCKIQDHANFVSSVCVIPPTTSQEGLMITGSNDKSIIVYDLDTFQKLYQLTGHEGTVCALTSGKAGTIISGSWDKTAKVWMNKQCAMTLEGHEAAVWVVRYISALDLLLTGSADKTIRVWRDNKCESVIRGHTDCVRDIAILDNNQFLSCSNDGTIRRWLLSGECIHVYNGHSSFVYSLALLPNEDGFVTTGEDKTLRVWQNTSCVQTVLHPCNSVWSVCVLQNGDIITGGSDAMIRVFTQCNDRMASVEDQKTYNDLVTLSNAPSKIAGMKMEDIPGLEVLRKPGQAGQQRMVRDGDKIIMYVWNTNSEQWDLLGDVTGSGSDDHAPQGKTLYKGKEYDYVFSVDIDPNIPALKLPYNLDENPWSVANDFLQANDLSPMFLDQVAKFIIDNSKAAQPHVVSTQPYSDPLTGSSRYIPPDLITGNETQYTPANSFFPRYAFLTVDAANEKQILDKLHEFNKKTGHLQIPESSINELSPLILGTSSTPELLTTLNSLLKWPKDYIFPALDVLRIAIKSEAVNQYFCTPGNGKEIVEFLKNMSDSEQSNANKTVALRILANVFVQKPGETACLSERDSIWVLLNNCIPGATKGIQIALTTVLLNYSIIYLSKNDHDGKSQCLTITKKLFEEEKLDQEAIFRLLVMLGNLLHNDEIALGIAASLGFEKHIQPLLDTKMNVEKVSSCAKYLLERLKVM
ncbi:phospholipase A-2-activating protein [Octopus bimaculoides]|uniref:Phospholipase A-2-activating protein n=1 Tax=Octopus bimaculoides TaxID=37653 RepID=A0A0L8FYJ1_OCTBM|nr:phospholipase A-2-activating protein [Octopus bimaculoides]|eukprot:XP_014785826.1 PREDICTED: phospholipase A-2-activating protein-like [Octopus bimaculoides]